MIETFAFDVTFDLEDMTYLHSRGRESASFDGLSI
jgi:hypothetical protein